MTSAQCCNNPVQTQVPDNYVQWTAEEKQAHQHAAQSDLPLTGHKLQDYQIQLMLLEQQNKKRLLMGGGSRAKSQGKESESSTSPEGPRIGSLKEFQEQGTMYQQESETLQAKGKGKEAEPSAATVPIGSKEGSAHTPVQGPAGSSNWARIPGMNQNQSGLKHKECIGLAPFDPGFSQNPSGQGPEAFMPAFPNPFAPNQLPSMSMMPHFPYPNRNVPSPYGYPAPESATAMAWPQPPSLMAPPIPPPTLSQATYQNSLLPAPPAQPTSSMRERTSPTCSCMACPKVQISHNYRSPPAPATGENSWLQAYGQEFQHLQQFQPSNNTKATAIDLTKEDGPAPKQAMQSVTYMASPPMNKSPEKLTTNDPDYTKSVDMLYDMHVLDCLETYGQDAGSTDSDWSRLTTPAGTPEADGFVFVEGHGPLAIRPAPEKES